MSAQYGGDCVDWGAIIFSTTVQSSDGDGLLDVWKANHGYTDLLTGQAVALPGATSGQQDVFVQIDYLSNLDGLVPSDAPHSHLPKQTALDMVGDTLPRKTCTFISMLGLTMRITARQLLRLPVPTRTSSGWPGGNKISESTVLCTDDVAASFRPGGSRWKEGLLFFKNQSLNYPDEISCEAACTVLA
jgi:hypothetical protein